MVRKWVWKPMCSIGLLLLPILGLKWHWAKSLRLVCRVDGIHLICVKKTYDDGSIVESKVKHYMVMPELKYWNCQAFERSFWGIHGIYSHFNMGGISFLNPLKDYRYQGDAYGGGISYGYQWALGSRWGLEASVGAGYLHLDYKKYEKEKCGEFLGDETYNYWGPTKAEVSFIYYLK